MKNKGREEARIESQFQRRKTPRRKTRKN